MSKMLKIWYTLVVSNHAYKGVYLITCIANQRVYVGSASNIYRRWCEHRSDLRRGVHCNPKLQRAFNKYGPNCFAFSVLERLSPSDDIAASEQKWMDALGACERSKGLNVCPIARSGKGVKRSESFKRAISDRMKGNSYGAGKGTPRKISKEDAHDILVRFASGESSSNLAAEYNITYKLVIAIARRQAWACVAVSPEIQSKLDALRNRRPKGSASGTSKLKESDIPDIRERLEKGEPLKSIAADYGVSFGLIGHIKKGKIWSHVPSATTSLGTIHSPPTSSACQR